MPVLRCLDLNVKPGQTVAFVGPSGYGKSTVMQLLLCFYDPDEGELKFASPLDLLLMFTGSLCAVINGVCYPGNQVLFTKMLGDLVDRGLLRDQLESIPEFIVPRNITPHDVFSNIDKITAYCTELYNYTNGTINCDDLDVDDNIDTLMNENIALIHTGIGDQVGVALQYGATFVFAYCMSFFYSWKLSLVMVSLMPLMILSSGVSSGINAKLAGKMRIAYAKAGAIAEEAFSAIRTVAAFGGEDVEGDRYCNNLHAAKDVGVRMGLVSGVGKGFLWSSLFFANAMGFWYGGKLVRHDDIEVSEMFTVYFCIFLGTMGAGFAIPAWDAFRVGQSAAYGVFEIIKQKPNVDNLSTAGLTPLSISGSVEFRNVNFSYPTRPDVVIFSDLSLTVPKGQTVAFVGSSGCGKSTATQLLLRFYDVLGGKASTPSEEDFQGSIVSRPEAFLRLAKLSRPEALYIFCGCLASFLIGSIDPTFGVLVGGVTKESTLAVAGQALTLRMRDILFRSMIKQRIEWFDDQRHEPSVLTTRLATDASLVQTASATTFGLFLYGVGAIFTGMTLGFIFGWRLAFAIGGFMPLLMFGGYHQIRVLAGRTQAGNAVMARTTSHAMQAVGNIRTVTSLTKEPYFLKKFEEALHDDMSASAKNLLISGLTYGFSQSTYYYCFVVCFYYGGHLLVNDDIEFYDMIKVYCCMAVSSVFMGRAVGFVPDLVKAWDAARHILTLADESPVTRYQSGLEPSSETARRPIRFSKVSFKYPMRPEVMVLNDLNLTVSTGQTLALVGQSGCGKSTTVQLVERFYDPLSGSIHLGDYDIQSLNLKWLRQQMGLVSQEPVLFDRSIAENIAYGDNSRVVPLAEIITAARSANIHNFIQGLPLGYDTMVGSKGTQLSGGQKQRVAIARALVRNPKILLLDEATSALDTESEQVVQEALDKAREGRTCIVIAHRLSTIKHADKIVVFSEGKMVEEGSHAQLMARHGVYYKMCKT
ncbi:ATP-dependent translocase ABCB1 [Aplysia californica]|uniref:ATP-dependent translocase ABCB1 n=1 Tax=Aplysia californica TaxID=6500 RepID=A0ABM1VRT3_APLCA|nr:ATP-dependent translocase ABCB1 [Aplysia californica]